MFRANNFDKLLDKATSNLRLEPDWPTILQICDLIRQNDCSPKYAVAAVKKKLYSQNPHQAMFALLTLESIVKNCGSGVHDEVASKAFCENLRDLVKTTQHENLKTKILELIQAWAFAFRNSPKYRAVQDTVNILKAEGFKFPTLKESDAMFSADTAPEWADGEVCHRCRVAFSLIMRRHHCRACGQVFCQQCSSKTSTLPKFGIEKEVRVCDACYDKVSRPPPASTKLEIVDTSNDYGPTQPQKRPPGKSAEELQEEEELQLALALSQSEAEQKEKEKRTRSHPVVTDTTTLHPIVSSTSSVSASPDHAANSELSRYLDRNYWEQRSQAAPTAPSSSSNHQDTPSEVSEVEYAKPVTSKATDEEDEDKEIDEFVDTLKSQIEIFVNRMKSNSSRGRSIANDTAVQNLFMNITTLHSKLLRYIQQQDDKRVYLESLQDKVAQIRDSRAALDTLRAENAAREAAAAEAAERQRQMQMAAKLHAMRKKKHEYLQYQRQLALQRVQEQEREMQMRQEQQKHQYMMSANSGYYMPGMSMPQYQPGYPNQPIYANPQYHPQNHPQIVPQSSTDVSASLPGQPLMSQANVPMSQMGPMTQSMPQIPNQYSMTTGAPITQTQTTQPSMNQPIRAALSQPMHQQMMMQHMQMRMPGQPGQHQIMASNLPGQNPQMQKQNLPNQPQQPPNSMMPQISTGQNMSQSHLNPSNPMVGMQMQNMRMPMMQGQGNPNQVPVSGYQMQNMNNQPQNSQPQNMQRQSLATSQSQPGQMMGPQSLPSQIGLPGQMPTTQSVPMPGSQVPNAQNQQLPQMSQSHMMQMPGQPIQQHMSMQNHMLAQGQNIPQQQMMNNQQGYHEQQQQIHGPGAQMQGVPMPQHMNQSQIPQQMGSQGQQIGQNPQMLPQNQQMQLQNQQMPSPNQQMPPQNQQMQLQNQQMPPQNQQMPQGQPTGPQAQQMPPPGSQMGQMPQNMPQNMQPKVHFANGTQNPTQDTNPQTPVKSERNNNTAELISFD